MFSRPTWSKCKGLSAGFTLIEVLVAVALLAVIGMLTWQALGSATASKERSETRDRSWGGANLALSRMTSELQMAVLFTNTDWLGSSPSGEQRTKQAFIGKNTGDQDSLTFCSAAHTRYLKDVKESDLAEVGYFLESNADEGPFVLKKREASPPDEVPEEGGTVTTILTGIHEMNFRYFDSIKNEFVDEWDSTQIDHFNKLPRAVEVELILQDPVDEEGRLRFKTMVLIEMPGPSDPQ